MLVCRMTPWNSKSKASWNAPTLLIYSFIFISSVANFNLLTLYDSHRLTRGAFFFSSELHHRYRRFSIILDPHIMVYAPKPNCQRSKKSGIGHIVYCSWAHTKKHQRWDHFFHSRPLFCSMQCCHYHYKVTESLKRIAPTWYPCRTIQEVPITLIITLGTSSAMSRRTFWRTICAGKHAPAS